MRDDPTKKSTERLPVATGGISRLAYRRALIAGIVIAETEYRDEVEIITAPFRGLGLGIFLITVGMTVDLRLVTHNWQGLLIALLAVLAVKAIHELHRTGGRYALVTMCVGDGQGIAAVFERL